jgi:outer membrane protein assembly factor BamA
MMAKVTRYVFLLIAMFAVIDGISQSVFLSIHAVDKDEAFIHKEFKPKTAFSSTAECYAYINQLPTTLQAKGFLSASLDSVYKDSITIHVQLFLGGKYVWKNLQVDEKDWPLLHDAGIKQDVFNTKPFNPLQVIQLQEKVLDYCESNGYPFAKIQFDSIQISANEVTAKLVLDKGILYKMDSIRVYGNAKINKLFLYRYLNILPNTIYSKEKLQAINQRLIELPYLQQAQPWRLNMLAGSYLLDLFLQQKKSNQVDAIVGFLPSNQQLGGKLLFTVDAKLNLQNAFATGETIALNWQQIQPQSPRLNLLFQRPYIFNSQFGLDFSFDLYKKDSAYLNLNTSIGVQYILGTKQKVKVLLQSFRTNLLDVDTNSIKATKQLPNIIDASVTSIAFEYELANTNYRYNPSKGNEIKLSFAGGNKKTKQNNAISQIKDPFFNYSKLYDTINASSYQLKARLNAAQYFPLGKYSVFKTALNAGIMQSPQIFRNEMFQIGGYRLLRGFDEESIFTNQFVVGTLEYRYLIDLNSYFSVFSDIGQASNKITGISNTFIGGGFGFAFQTKQGIFNINYAAGKRNDLPFNLRESKIHLGFVSLF